MEEGTKGIVQVPSSSISLMHAAYRTILPQVRRELAYWGEQAEQIPDKELRTQALASMGTKGFHCQGGSIYALLAGAEWKQAVRFVVAYQTISDYLDNLCDRSTSLDPADFRQLHTSMQDALAPGSHSGNYYSMRKEQDDGGYLRALVATCQNVIERIAASNDFKHYAMRLNRLYCDLQVYKHVKKEDRLPLLKEWYSKEAEDATLFWQEFAAASGSTLGIFCLVSYALGGRADARLNRQIHETYFPYVQGLHILLDYFIDQHEDTVEGDLNFCHYYKNEQTLQERIQMFIEKALIEVEKLDDSRFHNLVVKGLLGLYLSDPKVKKLKGQGEMKRAWLASGGPDSRFFYWNARVYYAFSRKMR